MFLDEFIFLALDLRIALHHQRHGRLGRFEGEAFRLESLDLVEHDSTLAAHADATRVAAVGHSAGGGTVLQAANEIPAVQGYVSLASGALSGLTTEPFSARTQ